LVKAEPALVSSKGVGSVMGNRQNNVANPGNPELGKNVEAAEQQFVSREPIRHDERAT
jgi:hypothetical protein